MQATQGVFNMLTRQHTASCSLSCTHLQFWLWISALYNSRPFHCEFLLFARFALLGLIVQFLVSHWYMAYHTTIHFTVFF
ncbi:hypothetical protein AB205_0090590 [Aquarana catesbeiana]|uniref:Uncharacterized protein n=1 Tax=Aquarana catesbeiana TaxID=8400 RepID=A0A2G9R8F7_AQUCT|nr:hypothetical protein AB205_0090590 [Aquarana catesbeiana]